MISFLIFLVSVYQLQQPVYSVITETSHFNLNGYDVRDDLDSNIPPEISDDNEVDTVGEIPFVKTDPDQTEVEFRQPIKSVNIDYSKNAIILKFRKQQPYLDSEELERRKSLEANFMRFGRDQAQNFMRFGKRAIEHLPNINSIESDANGRSEKDEKSRFERSSENSDKNDKLGLRDSRGDNFMRFGRSSGKEFMRFGRDPGKDYMRFGRNPAQDFMRFGREPGRDYMRFGRNPAQDFMRFGRDPGRDYMRFGRNPAQNFMRFGRDPDQDYMRFGKSSAKDFIRFGRSPGDFMRLGRSPAKDFMRFGRAGSNMMHNADKNFMRFGRPDNFMRFGRSDQNADTEKPSNFMRFGRTNVNTEPSPNAIDEKDTNHTTTTRLLQKTDIKAAAKLLHETDPVYEESNPMDKAIQVLFSKHDPEQTLQQKNSLDDTSQETEYQL